MRDTTDRTTKIWELRLSLKPGQAAVCQVASVMEKAARTSEAGRISVDRFFDDCGPRRTSEK